MKNLPFYDLHCDTATFAHKRNLTFQDESLHINRRSIQKLGNLVQVFAIFYADERTDSGMDFFFEIKEFLKNQTLHIKKLKPFLSCEGGNIIGNNLNNISTLAENNVKFFGLVWNGTSNFATGAVTDQNSGLKPLGKDCVKELNAAEIIIDVSHLSDAGFNDVAQICEAPFVATHSNSRTVCENCRNLTDDQIKIITERQGLIGLNLNPPFLTNEKVACFDDVIKHADKILTLGAENVLSLGCDLDGIQSLPKGFRNVADLAKLKKSFDAYFGSEIANKIFGKNAENFFINHICNHGRNECHYM